MSKGAHLSNDEVNQLKELLAVKFSDEELRALSEALSDMRNEVTVYTFVDDNCTFCNEAVELMNILSRASPRSNQENLLRHVIIHKSKNMKLFNELGIERVPTIVLLDGAIRYVGVPAGEEIRGLVETIIRISTGDSGLSKDVVKKIENLDCEVGIKIIVTPLCPYCPYAVLLANMVALEGFKMNKKISVEIVEAFENPDIADSYGITNVPAIVVNNILAYVGVPYENEFIEILEKACQGQ